MFHNCKNLDDSKKLFRKLAMRLHPDHGGDNELMILLQEAYNNFQFIHEELEKQNKQKDEEKSKKENCNKYENAIEDVELGDESLKIIDEILEYAKNHERFKADFTESIKEYLEEHGHITSMQYNKLVKIYYSFRMDKEKKETK